MTILTVVRGACIQCQLAVPDAVMASTTVEMIEMAELLQDCAVMIAQSAAWQLLRTVHTLTGDASTTSFALPSDYDWMPTGEQVWGTDIEAPMGHVPDTNEWLGLEIQDFVTVTGIWTIYGGQMHIRPAMNAGKYAKFFYQSNKIWTLASNSASAATPVADGDTFRLDERLLKLALTYRWKQAKGLPYAEELNDYETMRERLIARDRGAQRVVIGTARMPRGVSVAYPGTIGT